MRPDYRLPAVIVIAVLIATLAGLSPPGWGYAAERSLPQVDVSLYATAPPALTPASCGQCHTSQFTNLQKLGGKHRFACQECHEVFHAYSPRKNNYEDLMPACATCHGKPHGEIQIDCLKCHQNPHAPQLAPSMEQIRSVCADCHSGPGTELKQFPSAHTQQDCQICHHDKHGYIPNCSECHDGHYAEQPLQECMSCHTRVHAPLQISFSGNVNLQTCGGCHNAVYAKWQKTPSKHGQVTCVTCHEKHGQIPNCLDCHEVPHNKKQLEMFPNCLTCHLDVHNLPVKH